DGIRDRNVTGVQTCALPIFPERSERDARAPLCRCATISAMRALSSVGGPLRLAWLTLVVWGGGCATKAEAVQPLLVPQAPVARQIGRASCRERGWSSVGVV